MIVSRVLFIFQIIRACLGMSESGSLDDVSCHVISQVKLSTTKKNNKKTTSNLIGQIRWKIHLKENINNEFDEGKNFT